MFQLFLCDVALEEVLEEGADHGYCGDSSNGLPVRGDGGLDDVGRQLKGKSSDQPARVAKPGLPRELLPKWLESRS